MAHLRKPVEGEIVADQTSAALLRAVAKKIRTEPNGKLLDGLQPVYEYTAKRDRDAALERAGRYQHAMQTPTKGAEDELTVKCSCGEAFDSVALYMQHTNRVQQVYQVDERNPQYPLMEIAANRLRRAKTSAFGREATEVRQMLQQYAHCDDVQIFLLGNEADPDRFVVRLLGIKNHQWDIRFNSGLETGFGWSMHHAFRPGDSFSLSFTSARLGADDRTRLWKDFRMAYECALMHLARETEVVPAVNASVTVNADQKHLQLPANFDTRTVSVGASVKQHTVSATWSWRTFHPHRDAPMSIRPYAGESVCSALSYVFASPFAWSPTFRASLQNRLQLAGLFGGESHYFKWECNSKLSKMVVDQSGPLFSVNASLLFGYIQSFRNRLLHPLDRHYHQSTTYWTLGPRLETAPSVFDGRTDPPAPAGGSAAGAMLYYNMQLGFNLMPIYGFTPLAFVEFANAVSQLDGPSMINMIEESNVTLGVGASVRGIALGLSYPIVSQNPNDNRQIWFNIGGES